MRFEIVLIHPDFVGVIFGIFVFAQLPVGAPAGIGAVDRIDNTLILAHMIAVVVHADQVAVFIKDKLVGIAQAGGEDFKITAIGFAAHDDALVGVVPVFAVFIGNAHADIADAVINTP